MSATLAAFVFAALVAGAAACGEGESWAIAAGAKKTCCSSSAIKSFMYEVDGGIHDDNIKVRALAPPPCNLPFTFDTF